MLAQARGEKRAVGAVRGEAGFDQNGGPARGREHHEPRLLHAVIAARMDPGDGVLDQGRQLGGFAQVFVQLQVAQDEAERPRRGARGTGLEPDRLVFHLGHPLLVLGLCVRKKVGLGPARSVGTPYRRHGVYVDADEQIALRLAERSAIRQVDEGIGGAGEQRPNAAA